MSLTLGWTVLPRDEYLLSEFALPDKVGRNNSYSRRMTLDAVESQGFTDIAFMCLRLLALQNGMLLRCC